MPTSCSLPAGSASSTDVRGTWPSVTAFAMRSSQQFNALRPCLLEKSGPNSDAEGYASPGQNTLGAHLVATRSGMVFTRTS